MTAGRQKLTMKVLQQKTKTQKPTHRIQPINQTPKKPLTTKSKISLFQNSVFLEKNSSRTSLSGTSSSLDDIIVYVELVTALHKCSKLREKKNLEKQKQMKKQYQGLKGAGENKIYSQCNPSSFVRFKEFNPIPLLISWWSRPTFWHEA